MDIPTFMILFPPEDDVVVVILAVVLVVVSVEIVEGLTTRAQSLSTSSRLKLKVETACPVLLLSLLSARLVQEPSVQ